MLWPSVQGRAAGCGGRLAAQQQLVQPGRRRRRLRHAQDETAAENGVGKQVEALRDVGQLQRLGAARAAHGGAATRRCTYTVAWRAASVMTSSASAIAGNS